MFNKKGFSLLLFLVYLVLFTMVTFFSCHIIVSFIIPSLSSLRTCRSVIALHIASDLFVRDIHAINENNNWKRIHPQELVWASADHDIGWRLNNSCLERIEGEYNQGWTKKTVSIVAYGLNKVMFNIQKNNDHIVGIELTLTPIRTTDRPVICYVALRRKEKL